MQSNHLSEFQIFRISFSQDFEDFGKNMMVSSPKFESLLNYTLLLEEKKKHTSKLGNNIFRDKKNFHYTDLSVSKAFLYVFLFVLLLLLKMTCNPTQCLDVWEDTLLLIKNSYCCP